MLDSRTTIQFYFSCHGDRFPCYSRSKSLLYCVKCTDKSGDKVDKSIATSQTHMSTASILAYLACATCAGVSTSVQTLKPLFRILPSSYNVSNFPPKAFQMRSSRNTRSITCGSSNIIPFLLSFFPKRTFLSRPLYVGMEEGEKARWPTQKGRLRIPPPASLLPCHLFSSMFYCPPSDFRTYRSESMRPAKEDPAFFSFSHSLLIPPPPSSLT